MWMVALKVTKVIMPHTTTFYMYIGPLVGYLIRNHVHTDSVLQLHVVQLSMSTYTLHGGHSIML